MMECEWGDGYHFQARPIKTSHLCPPCSFHLCLAGERDDFGSYMTQISIHKRKGAWILKSPLGGESSTDPKYLFYLSVQFSSVTQLCLTLCDPMNCSTPGLSVHHQLSESTQTHVHQVSDAIQPSHPLLSPSPPAFNLSQHLGLFK